LTKLLELVKETESLHIEAGYALEIDAEKLTLNEKEWTFVRATLLKAHLQIVGLHKTILTGRRLTHLVTQAIDFAGPLAISRLLKVVNRDSMKNTACVKRRFSQKWNPKRFTTVAEINFYTLSAFDVANVKAMCKRFEKEEQKAIRHAARHLRLLEAKQRRENAGWYVWKDGEGEICYVKDGSNEIETRIITEKPANWVDVALTRSEKKGHSTWKPSN
jgi:hypothetical protein